MTSENLRYKNEIVKVNVNWSYGHVNGSTTPIATVDFKLIIHDLHTAEDYIMEGKHLVGEVEVKKVAN